jgi:hypothetical protein
MCYGECGEGKEGLHKKSFGKQELYCIVEGIIFLNVISSRIFLQRFSSKKA